VDQQASAVGRGRDLVDEKVLEGVAQTRAGKGKFQRALRLVAELPGLSLGLTVRGPVSWLVVGWSLDEFRIDELWFAGTTAMLFQENTLFGVHTRTDLPGERGWARDRLAERRRGLRGGQAGRHRVVCDGGHGASSRFPRGSGLVTTPPGRMTGWPMPAQPYSSTNSCAPRDSTSRRRIPCF
jgi:hypothetical protein